MRGDISNYFDPQGLMVVSIMLGAYLFSSISLLIIAFFTCRDEVYTIGDFIDELKRSDLLFWIFSPFCIIIVVCGILYPLYYLFSLAWERIRSIEIYKP